MDKNESFLTFLQSYTDISSNSLFFNYGDLENDAYQINVSYNDVSLNRKYIDGSELRRYTINIDSFKSVSTIPVIAGYSAENVEDMQEVQGLLDWITEQAESKIYPDFGEDCIIDDMKPMTTEPQLLGIDTTVEPPIAIYRITIRIDYIDLSKRLWSTT